MIGYDVGLAGYKEEQGRAFQQQALDVVSRLPGVEAVSYSSSVPLSIDQSNSIRSLQHDVISTIAELFRIDNFPDAETFENGRAAKIILLPALPQ